MSTWTVSEARAALSQIIDEVSQGGEVTLTRHGEPVAVIVRPDSSRVRLATRAAELRATLNKSLTATRDLVTPPPGLSIEYAEELVAEIREGRDSR